jgi:hypothetical protein
VFLQWQQRHQTMQWHIVPRKANPKKRRSRRKILQTWHGKQPQEARARASYRLRSLFKIQAQGADRVEELEQAPVVPRDISDSVGDAS